MEQKVFNTDVEGSAYVAREIANVIKANNEAGKNTILGLATGGTPVKMYKELIRIHKEEGLTFKNVISFNLDEYLPMEPSSEHSYRYFMNVNLFDHIDIDKANTHVPSGTLDEADVEAFCLDYEKQIEAAGGLDIQVLGIGRTGHIGFNEPGSAEDSITRMVILNQITIDDAAPGFGGEENVPKKAITMGVSTILKADKIYLMAWGTGKAQIVAQSINGEITDQVPATFLQKHSNTEFVLDTAAAGELELA